MPDNSHEIIMTLDSRNPLTGKQVALLGHLLAKSLIRAPNDVSPSSELERISNNIQYAIYHYQDNSHEIVMTLDSRNPLTDKQVTLLGHLIAKSIIRASNDVSPNSELERVSNDIQYAIYRYEETL